MVLALLQWWQAVTSMAVVSWAGGEEAGLGTIAEEGGGGGGAGSTCFQWWWW